MFITISLQYIELLFPYLLLENQQSRGEVILHELYMPEAYNIFSNLELC